VKALADDDGDDKDGRWRGGRWRGASEGEVEHRHETRRSDKMVTAQRARESSHSQESQGGYEAAVTFDIDDLRTQVWGYLYAECDRYNGYYARSKKG